MPKKKKVELTELQMYEIGFQIATMLQLRKCKNRHDLYQTTWGTKTNVGICNTILRLADDIRSGRKIIANPTECKS